MKNKVSKNLVLKNKIEKLLKNPYKLSHRLSNSIKKFLLNTLLRPNKRIALILIFHYPDKNIQSINSD